MSNNDIPIKLQDYLYVLFNRSIMCNSELGAEENFLLDSLVAYKGSLNGLQMWFRWKQKMY